MMKEVFRELIEKKDVIRYIILGVICLVLISVLMIFRGGPTGFVVYFVDQPSVGQTTLMLQTGDSDNLGDAYVRGSDVNNNFGTASTLKTQNIYRTYINFNISGVPENQAIDNATLCLYVLNTKKTQLINASHVYVDFDESIITWNNQPCGDTFDNFSACNLTAESFVQMDSSFSYTWRCWEVTDMVGKDYNLGNKNISIVIYTEDSDGPNDFYSKEYATDSTLRPYLNITYHTANTAPLIILDYPQQGATYGYNESIELNFSVFDSDNNNDSCWYNINGGGNINLASCANTTFNVAGDGSYVVNIYANDSFGEESNDSAGFDVQIGAPSIVLYFPINEYLNYQENINFNYTPTDVDLDSCELWGDFNGSFGLNQTNTNPINNSINTFILNLSDSEYFWNIRCNDSVGNSAVNGNKTFYIDTVNPEISVSEPSGKRTSRTISASWSVSDNNLDSCWYNVYQGASLEVVNSSVTCSDNLTSFGVSADANFVFNFYVNDSAGNKNHANSSFSVDTSSSTPPSNGGSSGGGGGGYFPGELTGRMQVTQIGEIIAHGGDEKSLFLNVKNVGSKFLNNCRLIAKGYISSWIYLDQIEGIAPGENVDFNFNLNVPEEIGAGDYSGELKIDCDEGENTQEVNITIPGLESVEIKDLIQKKQELNINYSLNDENLIGKEISIEIWLVDREGVEIRRITDSFLVEGVAERSVLMKLPYDLAGVYFIYFAFSSDLDNFVRRSVVLGKSKTLGGVIIDGIKEKMTFYVLFLLILGVGVFFIWRRHKENSPHVSKTKNRWLLKKKGFFRNY